MPRMPESERSLTDRRKRAPQLVTYLAQELPGHQGEH
jgi:hypothetical protein